VLTINYKQNLNTSCTPRTVDERALSLTIGQFIRRPSV